jgi:hypothetical protein
MNEAIKLAIEKGGWGGNCYNCLNPWKGHKQTRIGNRYCPYLPDKDKAVLDPLFWQSLGKALGWGMKINHQTALSWEDGGSAVTAEWLHLALIYHELVLTGGETEKFWKELLSRV